MKCVTLLLSNVNSYDSITANALLLKETEKWDKESIEELFQASKMLNEIFNNTLEMSKLVEGKLEFNKKYESISSVIEIILGIIRPNANKKGVKVSSVYDSNIPPLIELDRLRVTQVIMNLLENAIKFTPEKGSVAVNVKWYPKVVIRRSLKECKLRKVFTANDKTN
jgi:signal transduction histidine kinase